jgi:class 3 adenylate cyclase
MGEDVGGIAVHIAARISSEAGAGEVLTSSTVKDLVVGSGLSFLERVVASSRGSRASGGCSRPPEAVATGRTALTV